MTSTPSAAMIVAVCTKCLTGIVDGMPYVGIRHLCGGRIRSLVEPLLLDDFTELELDGKLDLKLKPGE